MKYVTRHNFVPVNFHLPEYLKGKLGLGDGLRKPAQDIKCLGNVKCQTALGEKLNIWDVGDGRHPPWNST